jgi:hypothetical protein
MVNIKVVVFQGVTLVWLHIYKHFGATYLSYLWGGGGVSQQEKRLEGHCSPFCTSLSILSYMVYIYGLKRGRKVCVKRNSSEGSELLGFWTLSILRNSKY